MSNHSSSNNSTNHMPLNKDEELQLCIQRFVSDTQSMVNQLSEVFITEVRQFADVCMEFSLAYRGLQEDREFLTLENRSLKDELETRISEIEILSKELRETREENEDLLRQLESFPLDSDGQIASVLADSNVTRHYAVVNSMPAFPRRYSVATSVASYDGGGGSAGPSSAAGHRETSSIGSSTPSPDPAGSMSSNACNMQLLTPPIAFKNSGQSASQSTSGKQSPQSQQTSSKIERKSLSKDDISIYAKMLSSFAKTSTEKLLIDAPNRSPSLDEMVAANGATNIPSSSVQSKILTKRDSLSSQAKFMTPAISSSAGTFYDCVSVSNFDVNTQKDNQTELVTVRDQIERLMASMNSKQTPEVVAMIPKEVNIQIKVSDGDNGQLDTTDSNTQSDSIEAAIVEFDELQKRFEHQVQLCSNLSQTDNETTGNSSSACFISKTPSPNSFNFDQHFYTYRTDQQNSRSDLDDTGSQLTVNQEDEHLLMLDSFCPKSDLQVCSKKFSKIKKEHTKCVQNSFQSSDLCQIATDDDDTLVMSVKQSCSEANLKCDTSLPLTSEIDILKPNIELNRYLLVEVSHFISPSHFYLIVNDEKFGCNAFEDFLENFQNFYKSFAYDDIGMSSNDLLWDGEENEEWRIYFCTPPPVHSLTVGSFWACFIDEDLDWRRVQIMGPVEIHNNDQIGDSIIDETVLVRDMDSGYSSAVSTSTIRPLCEEFALVPAFAIRASLAFIYPRQDDASHKEGEANSDFYDHWSQDSCQLFEELTYDQILTTLVLQIDHETLTDTNVAQVLLWCTSVVKEDCTEIFINRKMIELKFASNVAEDDLWIDQYNEVSQLVAIPVEQDIQKLSQSKGDSTKPQTDNFSNNSIINDNPDLTQTSSNSNSLKRTKTKNKSGKRKTSTETGSHKNSRRQSSDIAEPEPEPNHFLLFPSTESKTHINSVCPSFLEEINGIENSGHLESKCLMLHHDPRLSNWIVQRHSRHICLKKSDKVSYLFRTTFFIEPNKFIGILPFGEKKLDNDTIMSFVEHFTPGDPNKKASSSQPHSPFRQFVQEVSDYYQKTTRKNLQLPTEVSPLEQANNQTVVFYDQISGLYLRGHIVSKDTTGDNGSMNLSKSVKNLFRKNAASLCEEMENKQKSLSLKRNRAILANNCTKWILYGIDTGAYYRVLFKHLFELDDRFANKKPFAIACKLNEYRQTSPEYRNQLQTLMENNILGLQFHDIDFSTERFSVSLYRMDVQANSTQSVSSSKKATILPQNILSLL